MAPTKDGVLGNYQVFAGDAVIDPILDIDGAVGGTALVALIDPDEIAEDATARAVDQVQALKVAVDERTVFQLEVVQVGKAQAAIAALNDLVGVVRVWVMALA